MQFNDGNIDGVVLIPYKKNTDKRGWLVEIFRTDELDAALCRPWRTFLRPFRVLPAVPHEHVDQTDFFGFIGPSTFQSISLGCAEEFCHLR